MKVQFAVYHQFLCLCIFVTLLSYGYCRQSTIYHNQFAVHIPKGQDVADEIARKHGFTNHGQIGSLSGYYLFEHQRVRKRSVIPSEEHHNNLGQEQHVLWVQQQHEHSRKKRDFADFSSFSEFPSYFTGGQEPEQRHHQPHYRGISSHNSFPDPLFKEQWYLNGGAKDGFDMNVGPAWQKGYTGKGVVVSILDDGIQTNHPDLAYNYDRDASTDINDNDDDPMPRDNGDNKHGTRCAGEVAAVAFNNYCGIGVAYNASIGGVRMLDGTVNDAVEARALGLNPDHIDIYSASWGPEDDGKTVDGPGPLARRAFIYGVTSGRKGRGSIFVWASGNGGRHTDSCNCDGYTNSIFTLSISSATQGGHKPWYLEECSSTLASTYSSGTPGHDRSVATVDMDGRLRPDYICTVEHTGTSASAPLAAGIAALALEANPEITWRDMQYLVVLTSRAGPLEKEDGWALNGVKRKVSHKFGYGLMDAGAMVSLAEQWTNIPPQHICKSQEITEERQIDSSFGSVLTAHMDVNGCSGTLNEVRFLEHVQCKVSLRFFPRGNLKILLTSPMGMTSTLLFERPRDVVSSNFDDWPFLSVHYWGEKAEGRWTLQILNSGSRRVSQPGILKKWQLIFYGTATSPIRLRSHGGVSFPSASVQQSVAQAPFMFPQTSAPNPTPAESGGFYGGSGDIFSNGGYQNFPNIYSAAGSDMQVSLAPLDSNNKSVSYQENLMSAEESNGDDMKKVSHNCDPECDSQGCYGQSPTQCVACKHYKLDNACVSRCPPRSFPSQGGSCWPCHESCETCAGAGQDSCVTCAPAHMRLSDLSVCLQQCPEGYYENTEQKSCIPCQPNCGSCQDRPDHCTSCDHHLVLYDNKCHAACPANTYETQDYGCEACHASCDQCSGPNETHCVSCRAGRFSLNSTCVDACPDGYYADKKRKECLKCAPGCSLCASGGVCLQCADQWVLNRKNKCLPKDSHLCSSGQYWEDSRCLPCHSSCDNCEGPSSSDCLSCPSPLLLQGSRCLEHCLEGFFLEQGMCVPCLHTCTHCLARTNCTQCASGLHLQNGECHSSCAPGYYSDRGVCTKCYLSCMTCSGPRRDQCVTCPRGWVLAAGECHPDCPEGFFKSDFGCQKCHHYCRTCKGEGPLECTSCPPHYMLEGGLCMECLGSQYYDTPTQLCKTCHKSCRACSGPGPSSCLACLFPSHLDKSNNQCVPCCLGGDVNDCCHCDTLTGECEIFPPADKRRTADSGNRHKEQQGSYQAIQDYSPFTSITALAIGACVGVVALFAVMLSVLQMRSKESWRKGDGYKKLSTSRHKMSEQVSLTAEESDYEDQLFTRT